MKIWKLRAIDEKYDDLRPVNGYSADELQSFDGRSHKEEWIPKKVKRLEPEKNLKLGDGLQCMGVSTFSQKAIEALFELIKNDVEILPLICDEGSFSMINVTTVLNATNYEKAEYKTFDDGRILRFIKYAFRESTIEGHSIFKIVDEPISCVFVTDDFVNLVKESNLEGFCFKLVWDSEEE